jgi:8-amino-7-oxononanoate synthase
VTHDPLAWLDDELTALDAAGLRRRLKCREGPQAGIITTDGERLVNFGSNDYLGLAADPRLAAAAGRASRAEGWGSGASPLVTGRSQSHSLLEQRLAEFEQAEAALLFPSGFAANAGTVAALASRSDMIFSDERNHASLIDGCRLSGAQVRIYPHRRWRDVEAMLKQAGGFRRRLIVTDSLFSMDGDCAPLVELADLAEQYDALLMVDEAHATGVFGADGRGLCEHLGVEHRVPVRIGTLSKALGSTGGFVVGQQRLIDYLVHRARSYVYSTAAPPALAAAAVAALDIVRDEPHRRTQLLARAERFRAALGQQGWNTGNSTSQIIPVILGDPESTMRLAAELGRRGIFVPGIRPPSVPEGQSLLRISLSCAHTDEMMARLENALGELGS